MRRPLRAQRALARAGHLDGRGSPQDLKAIFKVRREKTARALAEEFVELYGKRFPKAVSVFEAGIADALTYLSYPGSHHARIRTTNVLERLFEEVKRRTRVVGVFPNETSAATLATEIALRSSEQWALRRYLAMDVLEEPVNPNPQLREYVRRRPPAGLTQIHKGQKQCLPKDLSAGPGVSPYRERPGRT